jgi:hypothetical protein
VTTKPKNLYLYLTLACFFGLIVIFMVDGYMGVYDTIYVTAGEREQQVGPERWLRQDRAWISGTEWGEKALFRYEVNNRRVSTYSADIELSIWHSREKVLDLPSQQMTVAPFGRGVVEWVVDTAELKPEGLSPEQVYEYTVIIDRGEVERKVILNIRGTSYPIKPPAPVPVTPPVPRG